jgi:trimethylamine--corrinoid protein Co-methyltransferase
MGTYGVMATRDMMEMSAIVAGGKDRLRETPRFFAICSVMSPLQMAHQQIEGLIIVAEHRQPLAMSPEAIAGSTAPVTLAGLLAQQNANILGHITLAQIVSPGTPVLYGTVSTITDMKAGLVALGAIETGLITAASAQLARYYGVPSRSVGLTTESQTEDIQAGIERTWTLMPAVLAGVNFITCGGTLESSLCESDALLVLDDEVCGAMIRARRGIEVTDQSLAMDQIRRINFTGNYLAELETARQFRTEHFLPQLMSREPRDEWEAQGRITAMDRARERVREILANHQPRSLDPALEQELGAYLEVVRGRTIEAFYMAEEE